MKLQVIVHKEPDGGFWAEVPALPGCATQGDTMAELKANLREAIAACLAARAARATATCPEDAELIEVAV